MGRMLRSSLVMLALLGVTRAQRRQQGGIIQQLVQNLRNKPRVAPNPRPQVTSACLDIAR